MTELKVEILLKNYDLFEELKKLIKHININELIDNRRIHYTEFRKLCLYLNPQGRGNKYEYWYININNCKKVSPSLERGDFVDVYGLYCEYKYSGKNRNNKLNIAQIRPWQKIDYYIIQKEWNNSSELFTFRLTKKEMNDEIALFGQQSHGTNKLNKDKKHIEKSLRISKTSDNWKRWLAKYRVS
jgi:hypothetical protein